MAAYNPIEKAGEKLKRGGKNKSIRISTSDQPGAGLVNEKLVEYFSDDYEVNSGDLDVQKVNPNEYKVTLRNELNEKEEEPKEDKRSNREVVKDLLESDWRKKVVRPLEEKYLKGNLDEKIKESDPHTVIAPIVETSLYNLPEEALEDLDITKKRLHRIAENVYEKEGGKEPLTKLFAEVVDEEIDKMPPEEKKSLLTPTQRAILEAHQTLSERLGSPPSYKQLYLATGASEDTIRNYVPKMGLEISRKGQEPEVSEGINLEELASDFATPEFLSSLYQKAIDQHESLNYNGEVEELQEKLDRLIDADDKITDVIDALPEEEAGQTAEEAEGISSRAREVHEELEEKKEKRSEIETGLNKLREEKQRIAEATKEKAEPVKIMREKGLSHAALSDIVDVEKLRKVNEEQKEALEEKKKRIERKIDLREKEIRGISDYFEAI